MPSDEVIVRFNKVSFEYGHNKPILNEADFSVRRGSKMALMGQNGAGKSTIFQLITLASQAGALKPESGLVSVSNGLTIATARQVISRDQMQLTVREFFEKCFAKKIYDIDPRIDEVLEVVNLKADHDKIIKTFSGGQQARLLLASALIQNPDLLLLDEPTNNLDKQGIAHLTQFLIDYKKTCIVISHDADFLNAFTQGVLYLDIFTKKVEQYAGNYFDVVKEIQARIERERMKNVRLERDIANRKEQANFFAQKGGHMRDVARKMREKIEELEEEVVDVRQEDKTIRNFFIPCQEDISGQLIELKSVSVMKGHKPVNKKVEVILKKGERLLLVGPNGIGKTTLLEKLATGHAKGEYVTEGVKVGYYRQDFSTLNFEDTVWDSLVSVMNDFPTPAGRDSDRSVGADQNMTYEKLRAIAAGFLLILDEPTNHINFRHIPVIAQALDKYQGAMILVSHVPEFVKQIRIDKTLDLEQL